MSDFGTMPAGAAEAVHAARTAYEFGQWRAGFGERPAGSVDDDHDEPARGEEPLRDARATIDAHGPAALERMVKLLTDPFLSSLLLEHAKLRATGLGAAQYGNKTYNLASPARFVEAVAELADAVFYLSADEEMSA